MKKLRSLEKLATPHPNTQGHIAINMIPFHVLFVFGTFSNILSFFVGDKKPTISNLTGVFRCEIIAKLKNSVSFRFSGLRGFVNILEDCTNKILGQSFCLLVYLTL